MSCQTGSDIGGMLPTRKGMAQPSAGTSGTYCRKRKAASSAGSSQQWGTAVDTELLGLKKPIPKLEGNKLMRVVARSKKSPRAAKNDQIIKDLVTLSGKDIPRRAEVCTREDLALGKVKRSKGVERGVQADPVELNKEEYLWAAAKTLKFKQTQEAAAKKRLERKKREIKERARVSAAVSDVGLPSPGNAWAQFRSAMMPSGIPDSATLFPHSPRLVPMEVGEGELSATSIEPRIEQGAAVAGESSKAVVTGNPTTICSTSGQGAGYLSPQRVSWSVVATDLALSSSSGGSIPFRIEDIHSASSVSSSENTPGSQGRRLEVLREVDAVLNECRIRLGTAKEGVVNTPVPDRVSVCSSPVRDLPSGSGVNSPSSSLAVRKSGSQTGVVSPTPRSPVMSTGPGVGPLTSTSSQVLRPAQFGLSSKGKGKGKGKRIVPAVEPQTSLSLTQAQALSDLFRSEAPVPWRATELYELAALNFREIPADLMMSYVQMWLLGADATYKHNAYHDASEEADDIARGIAPPLCNRRHLSRLTVRAVAGMDLGPRDLVPVRRCCCHNHHGNLPQCKGTCCLAGTEVDN